MRYPVSFYDKKGVIRRINKFYINGKAFAFAHVLVLKPKKNKFFAFKSTQDYRGESG